MNSDFHYYGTATAAEAAGFAVEDAKVIANAAEFVDWFYDDYSGTWSIKSDSQVEPETIDMPVLSCQRLKKRFLLHIGYKTDRWNAFHFPPGNCKYLVGYKVPLTERTEEYWKQITDLKDRYICKFKVQDTNIVDGKETLLCRPYSKFALDMVIDTFDKYILIAGKIGEDDNKWQSNLIKTTSYAKRCIDLIDRKKLALIFLGIRMHVLADTWAHQDFTGSSEKSINDVGGHVYNGDLLLNLDMNQPLSLDMAQELDLDEARQEELIYSISISSDNNYTPITSNYGHGRMGHFPDYGWIEFDYFPSWKGGDKHTRNNPYEFCDAWSEMTRVLGLVMRKEVIQTNDIPEKVYKAITNEVALDAQHYRVPINCEMYWAANAGEKFTEERWGNTKYQEEGFRNSAEKEKFKKLGILGITGKRLCVEYNSYLHLFELASSIHYQWCREWAEKNQQFNWQPAAIS